MELTEFLAARIAEDEDAWRWFAADGDGTWGPHGRRHMAECEAKRRIVDTHAIQVDKDVKRGKCNEATEQFETCDYGYCYECDHDRDYGYIGSQNGLNGCPTLRLVALPYADHPDYRPEWRP